MSRRRGVSPASRIAATICGSFMLYTVPAADTTFSSIIVLPMSLHPKASDALPIRGPCVTHDAWKLSTLSR